MKIYANAIKIKVKIYSEKIEIFLKCIMNKHAQTRVKKLVRFSPFLNSEKKYNTKKKTLVKISHTLLTVILKLLERYYFHKNNKKG